MFKPLIACPACSCHARPTESTCPHCGAALLSANGTVERTAASVMLGLAVSIAVPTALTGCGDETSTSASTSTASGSTMEASVSTAAAYGVATTAISTDASTGVGGNGGAGGASGQGGAGGK